MYLTENFELLIIFFINKGNLEFSPRFNIVTLIYFVAYNVKTIIPYKYLEAKHKINFFKKLCYYHELLL